MGTKYDWEIEKRVEPTNITLDSSDSTELKYTIVATRLEPTITSTYTVTGRATATNDGDVNLVDVVIGVTLGSEEATSFIEELSQNDEVGFDFSFKVNSDFDPFIITVTATGIAGESVEITDTDSNDADAPGLPTPDTIEDASATIIDRVAHEPDGFSLEMPNRDWEVTEPSTVITYIATITNESAGSGDYYLTNMATLTEFDSGRKVDDDARVDIDVPSYVDLDVELDSNVKWEEEIVYDWLVEKTVDPTEVTLPVGELVSLDYTITATRNIHTYDSTYTVSGTVTVINSGNVGATGVNVNVELDETGDTENLTPGDTIPANGSNKYSFKFVTKDYYSSYKVIATVTADNHPDVANNMTKDTPDDPEKDRYIDETATVVDTITYIPTGFSISPVDATRTWKLNDSEKLLYSIVLTNDSYYTYSSLENFVTLVYDEDPLEVLNEVVLTEDDTNDVHEDDARVVINVPQCDNETAWGEGEHYGVGWAMYFYLSEDEEATTVRLIAAQHYDVGTVEARWIEENGVSKVEITYKTKEGFMMKEIHTDVAYDSTKLESAPGLFDYNREFPNSSPTEHLFKLERNRDGVYIAAHAVVINCDGAFDEE